MTSFFENIDTVRVSSYIQEYITVHSFTVLSLMGSIDIF
jgi:hypothetical protein